MLGQKEFDINDSDNIPAKSSNSDCFQKLRRHTAETASKLSKYPSELDNVPSGFMLVSPSTCLNQ